MNKSFFIVFFLLCNSISFGQQNLVYNGDFEIYDTCPQNFSGPTDYQIEHCLGWTAPTIGTSDYFNTCGLGCVTVPNNCIGHQIPYNGNGYCGFFGLNYDSYYWWEYIQGNLTVPLVAGNIYELKFYVSLAEDRQYALAKLGAHFSNFPISRNDTYPFEFAAHVESPAGVYYQDTTNWELVSGYYVATGGEEYITIGNFNDSTNSDTLFVLPRNPPFPVAYYYVDAVSLTDVSDQFEFVNVFSPNGDGINDIYSLPNLKNLTMKIFDRWGNLITELNEEENTWTGFAKNGNECSDGVYYYIADLGSITKKGFIQLVR